MPDQVGRTEVPREHLMIEGNRRPLRGASEDVVFLDDQVYELLAEIMSMSISRRVATPSVSGNFIIFEPDLRNQIDRSVMRAAALREL